MSRRIPLMLLVSLLVLGCQSTREMYYNATEKMGYAKRERLVDNVKAARDSQDAAKTQFTSALEQFKSVVNFSRPVPWIGSWGAPDRSRISSCGDRSRNSPPLSHEPR